MTLRVVASHDAFLRGLHVLKWDELYKKRKISSFPLKIQARYFLLFLYTQNMDLLLATLFDKISHKPA